MISIRWSGISDCLLREDEGSSYSDVEVNMHGIKDHPILQGLSGAFSSQICIGQHRVILNFMLDDPLLGTSISIDVRYRR